MRRLTLCVLLDAFRPDYIRHAPYLRALSDGRAAELREPFGFLPRAAYFGGLSPEQVGFTNMYACDPERSPFGLARAFDTRRVPPAAYESWGARGKIEESARVKVTPFARAYISTAQIPLSLLPSFSVVEEYAPWDRRVGYQSIFHDLDEANQPWFECSWPGTNLLADASDQGIVQAALDRAGTDARFGFVHLQALDACGHVFGPGAPETRDCIKATDALVEVLVETLRRRFDAVDVVVFGDHGMVPVTRGVDVAERLAAAPLRPGVDFTYFIDSTMVRAWLHTGPAKKLLPALLSAVPGAQLLDQGDLHRHRAAACDARNGELFLLADPGVVFRPNFFQTGDAFPRGMHGYDPDCADNRGIFICQTDDMPPVGGVIDATELHGILKQLVFSQPAHRSRRTEIRRDNYERFTQSDAPEAHALVRGHVQTITQAVTQVLTATPRAIVLTGSFGRGEGGVIRDDRGFRAVNDYDVLVVDDVDRSASLNALRESLPQRLGVDFVDLAWADGRWEGWQPSIANFDLKYGSTVIFGDALVLEGLPPWAAAEIPRLDALQLLMNRIGGLLAGMAGWPDLRPGTSQHAYLVNQYVKAATAIGDTHLIAWGGYDCSYLVRARRFRTLASGAGLAPALADIVTRAYVLKVTPDHRAIVDVVVAVRELIPLLMDRARSLVEECGTAPHDTLDDAMRAYTTLPLVADVEADDRRLASRPAIEALVRLRPQVSVRQLVYAMLPLALDGAAPAGGPALSLTSWPGWDCCELPARVHDWPEWHRVRERLADAWFAVIH
jgi:hypothetical protein